MDGYPNEEPGLEEKHDREEARWNIPIPIEVRGTRSDGAEFKEDSITADASPSGMCLLLTVELKRGERVWVKAPEENFESPAEVRETSSLGPHMNRVRVRFVEGKKFGRKAAAKKYVYDVTSDTWVGYLLEGTYYNSKHEPFGKVEGCRIVSLDSGDLLFTLRWDRVYDPRANCVGQLI
jgi:hypothetical protein